MAVTQELIDDIKKQLAGLSPEEQQKKLQEIMEKLPPEDREQLMGGSGGGGGCPFCSMVEGKVPVKKVYEDDKVMAILDINPANKGHVLLFPKEHAQFLPQMEDSAVAHLFKVANKLADIIFQTMGAQGTNILVANGPAAGQTAPHVLVNIIPRFEGDNINFKWQPKSIDESEMEDIAKKLSDKANALNVKKEETVVIKHEPEEVKKEDDFLNDLRIP